jgi:sugar-specific transcriptional regulator TrmB
MREIIVKMTEIGFSEYEAKAYLSLLTRQPATAYEIAKASGVPTSKVYEVLGRLIDKRIVSIIDEGKTRRYVPMEPGEFLERHRSVTEALVASLKSDLLAFKGGEDVSYIWNITEYGYLIDKGRRMIKNASGTLLLSLWPEELSLWEDDLRETIRRGVKVAIVHFGIPASTIEPIYQHPIEDTIYQEKVGRGMVLVADAAEVLIGTVLSEDKVEGAWSSNRGFVTLAEDYVKHDIYIMKMVRRFDKTLVKRFGPGYAKLRDIFKDEELDQ